ncbi:MAG: hypothetical protein AB8B85_21095 [Paracoccaceae bacterium]
MCAKPIDDRDLDNVTGGTKAGTEASGYQALPEFDANFRGSTLSDAYLVKCDAETTTQTAAKPTSTMRAVQIMK